MEPPPRTSKKHSKIEYYPQRRNAYDPLHEVTICVLFLAILFTESRVSAQHIRRQEKSSWCWAACIQDVEAQSGIRESQSQIAARLYGIPLDRGATLPQVVAVLHQSNIHGRWVMRPPMNPMEIVGAFSSCRKIIAFTHPGPQGHCVVLEAADHMGNVLVSDPGPGISFTTWMPVSAVYQVYHWFGSVMIQ
jgi:hypothetical protein